MSFIVTLTSSSASFTSMTSSAIALSDIVTGAVIASGALLLMLVLYSVMSQYDSWNANRAAAVRAICVPLIVTFCAFIVFEAARY
jgi:hypothetical protein